MHARRFCRQANVSHSQVDTRLMDQAATLLAKRFVDSRATAVLTAEMSGVAPALALAIQLRVPLICDS